MKERGIIFNTDMVQSILDGRKTVTRRPVKPQPKSHHWESLPYYELKCHKLADNHYRFSHSFKGVNISNSEYDGPVFVCPFGQIGDRLYVRETFTYDNKEYIHTYKDEPWRGEPDRFAADCYYKASEECPDIFPRWIPSIHMPKWAARIWLEITDIWVERVQDITEEQAMKEGVDWLDDACYQDNGWSPTWGDPDSGGEPRFVDGFSRTWNSIYNNWSDNPFCWVIEFKKVEK